MSKFEDLSDTILEAEARMQDAKDHWDIGELWDTLTQLDYLRKTLKDYRELLAEAESEVEEMLSEQESYSRSIAEDHIWLARK